MKRIDQPPAPAMSLADIAAHEYGTHYSAKAHRDDSGVIVLPRPGDEPKHTTPGGGADLGQTTTAWIRMTTEVAYIERDAQLADAVRRDLMAGSAR